MLIIRYLTFIIFVFFINCGVTLAEPFYDDTNYNNTNFEALSESSPTSSVLESPSATPFSLQNLLNCNCDKADLCPLPEVDEDERPYTPFKKSYAEPNVSPNPSSFHRHCITYNDPCTNTIVTIGCYFTEDILGEPIPNYFNQRMDPFLDHYALCEDRCAKEPISSPNPASSMY